MRPYSVEPPVWQARRKGVSAKGLRRVWRGIAAIGGLALCAGCGSAVTASNGSVFRSSEALPDALSLALVASASHDLPCAESNLDVRRLEAEREYAVTGCGSRVLYRVITPSLVSRRIELVSRSVLVPSTPNTEQVESKSSDRVEFRPAAAKL
jgi:hypothetical protein